MSILKLRGIVLINYKRIKQFLVRNIENLESIINDEEVENNCQDYFYICLQLECICKRSKEFSFYLSENQDDILFLEKLSQRYKEVRKKFYLKCLEKGINIKFEPF